MITEGRLHVKIGGLTVGRGGGGEGKRAHLFGTLWYNHCFIFGVKQYTVSPPPNKILSLKPDGSLIEGVKRGMFCDTAGPT